MSSSVIKIATPELRLLGHDGEGDLVAAAHPFMDICDSNVTREEVLERIDEDTLRSAPLNLLISSAIAIAQPDASVATEDAVIRYVAALATRDVAEAAFLRITAEKMVLADVEYQSALTGYARAEDNTPVRSEWHNPQHYLEACKVHERRMDRLLRTRKEAFDRYVRSAEVYRAALRTTAFVPAQASASMTTSPRGHGDDAANTTKNIQIIVR